MKQATQAVMIRTVMAIEYSKGKSTSSAKQKVFVSGLIGLTVFIIIGLLSSWRLAPILGWDVAALILAVWIWHTIWPMNALVTSEHALREDPSKAAADAILIGASLASLLAVGLVLSGAGSSGSGRLWLIALGVASVVAAWGLVHTLFTLRYAELYYQAEPGGVGFPTKKEPSYKDFAYLAFTVGMTFQTSDVEFESTDFRRLALKHAFISYLFGTVIVATTINLVAGLIK